MALLGEFDQFGALRATVAGKAIASADRKELLTKLAAGEIVELEIDFVAFQQVDGVANRNFLRFPKKLLRKLARTFIGMPLLTDHDDDDIDARVGTVIASMAEAIEGGFEFRMTALVTDPRGVALILRGLFDRFSIGWVPGAFHTILCSVENKPIFTVCSHFPGDQAFDDDGNVIGVAEFIFTEAVGSEVSGINVPAVLGTHIEEIRAALSATAKPATSAKPARIQSMSKIALSLGLPADADEATIEAKIAENAAALASAQSASGVEKAKADALESQLKAATERETQTQIDTLMTECADRFEKKRDAEGKLVRTEHEVRMRTYASKDFEGAKAMLLASPVVAQSPAGQPPAAPPVPVNPGAPAGSAILAKQLKKLGISQAVFDECNPINGTALDTADDDPSFKPRLWNA